MCCISFARNILSTATQRKESMYQSLNKCSANEAEKWALEYT